jgi:hypothetical protein
LKLSLGGDVVWNGEISTKRRKQAQNQGLTNQNGRFGMSGLESGVRFVTSKKKAA